MSEDKKGISPFKDPAFLKGSDKTRRADVSDEDIKEFRRAFSDSGESRTRTFPKRDTQKVKIPAPEKNEAKEDLYAVQSVDIDAFMASLSGSSVKKSEKPASAQKKDTAASSDKTRAFNLNDSVKKKISQTVRVPGEEKNIKKNVRVLVKSKQSDRHILDTNHGEEEKTNIIDVLSSVKDKDIFDAVDKAVTKDGDSPILAEALKNKSRIDRKKRDSQAIHTGKALRSRLIKQSRTQKIQLLFAVSLFFLSLVLSVMPTFYSEGNLLEFLFGNGGRLYGAINILLLIPLVGVFFRNYLSGIKSIRNLSPDKDFSLLVVTVFVLLHDVAVLVMGTAGLGQTRSYTCFAVFTAAATCLTDYFNTRTALGSITTVMKGKNLQSVQPMESKKDASAVAGQISDKDEPNILYCTDVEMSDSLSADVGGRHSESRFYTFSYLAVIATGFILYLISFIINRNVNLSLGILLSVICFCSPVTGQTACAVLNYIVNYRLNKSGAAATHNEGIHLVGKAHGVTMDISDIFTADVSSFRLMPGVLMKQNDAAIVASAVLINAGSLPGKCFEDFISQIGAELPLTENVQYEEKLGFSAWVSGKRVLVGSREMLIQHSIPVPDEREEKHYGMNKFVMYLVIEGRLTASFLVNYRALSSVRKLSEEFNKTGLLLLLTCKEPFLGHKEIAKRLSLESAAVRVLSGKSEAIVDSYRSKRITGLTGGLICAKAGHGLLNLVVNAYNLYVSDKFLFNVHITGQILALVIMALACILNMPLFFNPLIIIILRLMWSLGAYMITSNKSKYLK